MRKCGKGTLLLMSAVMAASLFTGCGKGKSSQILAIVFFNVSFIFFTYPFFINLHTAIHTLCKL